MPDGSDPATGIHRTVLGTFRSMFLGRLRALTDLQSQMEKLMRTMAKKANRADPIGWKVVEAWFSTFRQALANFQEAVEDGFRRAEEYFDKNKEE